VKLLEKYPTENDLKNISTQIIYVKNMMLTEKQIEQLGKKDDIPSLEIYKAYCSEMRRQSLMDYDDQMVYALTMLKSAPSVLEYFQEMYRYICVDEAQDTSKIQHEIGYPSRALIHELDDRGVLSDKMFTLFSQLCKRMS